MLLEDRKFSSLYKLAGSKVFWSIVVLVVISGASWLYERSLLLGSFGFTAEQFENLVNYNANWIKSYKTSVNGSGLDVIANLVSPSPEFVETIEDDEEDDETAMSNKECNYAEGRWVEDERRPLYSGLGCKGWLSPMWACRLMNRTDFSYEKFRWQPKDCKLREFTASKFLKRMRNKTLAFIGDSLGRQQFQSLMCMATSGLPSPSVLDVGPTFGLVKSPGSLRPDGWAYRFPSTNTTILFYWSATLCQLIPFPSDPTTFSLHLDRPVPFLTQFLPLFNVLVLNTGHHWNKPKFAGNRWVMHANGSAAPDLDIASAKALALSTVVRWVHSNRSPQLKAFLRTLSPRHFAGGDWNSGGTCDNTVLLSRRAEISNKRSSDAAAESAVEGTEVGLLDITAMSAVRDEGHISRYKIVKKSSSAAGGGSDCLHWCLPGVPDTWNEVLFAQI